MSQTVQALHKLGGSLSGPILPMRPTDPHQLTGAALRNLPVDQNADGLTPLWSAYHFFASSSFMASISRFGPPRSSSNGHFPVPVAGAVGLIDLQAPIFIAPA